MYRIIKFFDEELELDRFMVINRLSGKAQETFDTYDEAHSYVCSVQ